MYQTIQGRKIFADLSCSFYLCLESAYLISYVLHILGTLRNVGVLFFSTINKSNSAFINELLPIGTRQCFILHYQAPSFLVYDIEQLSGTASFSIYMKITTLPIIEN